jgi:arylsulfatase A-like enzyme
MDRSIGTLRKGLRNLSIENNTLVWFMSDNGGLPMINPTTTGGLRDFKGSLYEGGIRVPCVIEWPKGISKPRKTDYPAGAVDIFPTISEIVSLPKEACLYPQDGESLAKLFKDEIVLRKKPLIFSSNQRMAVIDNNWKLLSLPSKDGSKIELYDLAKDMAETTNLKDKERKVFKNLNKFMNSSMISIQKSIIGKDYIEGKVREQPPRIFWTEVESYKKYFNEWQTRPEYKRLKNK